MFIPAPVPTLPRQVGGSLRRAANHSQDESDASADDGALAVLLDEPDGLVEPAARMALAALGFVVAPPSIASTPVSRFVGLGGLADVCRCRLCRSSSTAAEKTSALAVSPPLGACGPADPPSVLRTPPVTCAYVLADPLAALLHAMHGCADIVLVLVATPSGPRLQYPAPAPVLARAGLTQRESDVLAQLLARRNDAEIAAALVVSQATVRSHCRAIFRKLGVGGRGEVREVLGVC
jgi:DNA-binding CsgD family transcriptional regulator